MIKILKDYFTPIRMLKYSLVYGWSVVLLLVLIPYLIKSNVTGITVLLAAILLSIRYSLMKPVLRTGAYGAGIVGVASILDYLFDNENSEYGFGALLGVLFMLVFFLLKNLVVSIWYLLRETVTFIQLRMDKATSVGSD